MFEAVTSILLVLILVVLCFIAYGVHLLGERFEYQEGDINAVYSQGETIWKTLVAVDERLRPPNSSVSFADSGSPVSLPVDPRTQWIHDRLDQDRVTRLSTDYDAMYEAYGEEYDAMTKGRKDGRQ